MSLYMTTEEKLRLALDANATALEAIMIALKAIEDRIDKIEERLDNVNLNQPVATMIDPFPLSTEAIRKGL
jgi:hypothetical protein